MDDMMLLGGGVFSLERAEAKLNTWALISLMLACVFKWRAGELIKFCRLLITQSHKITLR